jgi:3-mercaptopyruvate sulfurtransferase SseA
LSEYGIVRSFEMNKAAVVVLAGFLLLGSTVAVFAQSDLERVPRMGLGEFKALHESDSVYVVDVRYPWEYEQGHIPGAVLVPLDLVSAKAGELSRLTVPIVTYCQ